MITFYLHTMNNITALAVLVIILGCARPVPAQENRPYRLSVIPQTGMFYGKAEEIVYPTDTDVEKLSELLWDIKPVFYYGLELDFSRADPMEKWGLFSALSLKSGFPGASGKMEDRDWLSVENNALTNYSEHNNFTRELLTIDFSAGGSIPLKYNLLLKPYLNVSYMRFSFSGEGGHGIYARSTGSGVYASIDDAPDYWEFPDGEKVINYSQEWMAFSPGISLGWFFLDNFFTELSFQISPLVYCSDLDEHIGRQIQFRDYMDGGLFLQPAFRFSYISGTWFDISLDISWRFITENKGVTYQSSPIGSGLYAMAGNAGAGLSLMDLGLKMKIRL